MHSVHGPIAADLAPFIFEHIPKTAGTTFNLSYLAAAFPAEETFIVPGHADLNRRALQRLIELAPQEWSRFKVIAGHDTGQLRSYVPGARWLTLVRDPVQRVISSYLHARYHVDARDTLGREIEQTKLSISQYVEQDWLASRSNQLGSVQDLQAKILLGPDFDGKLLGDRAAVKHRIQSRYHLAGYTEAFELFLFLLHVTEGFPLVLFHNRLVREERAEFHLTASERKTIEHYNQADRIVYDCVREEFDRRIAAIWTTERAHLHKRYIEDLRCFQRSNADGGTILYRTASAPQIHSDLQPGTVALPEIGWQNPSEAFEAAKHLKFVRPLVPYPGWSFSADWNNPDLAFRMRRRIWQYFNERRIDVPFIFDWYESLKLNLYLGNDLSRQLFIAGCVEPNEFAFLDRILKPGMVFIDVGANDGIYTLFAGRRVGSAGKVWAFEPSRREFARLQQNISLNQLQNVEAFQVALGEQDDEVELAIAGYEHEGQNTLGAFVHQGVTLLKAERVAMRRLDSLVQEAKLAKVDVIKLDVEGAEHRVIDGARAVLTQFRPVVLFEVLEPALQKQGSDGQKLCGLLSSLHYQLFMFDDVDGQPAPAVPTGAAGNLIAIPAESSLVERYVTREHANKPSVPTVSVSAEPASESPPQLFDPARAYWNHRITLDHARERILSLAQAVDQPTNLWPYQWAQLMAAVMEYEPDLVLELGRDRGNSTCAFTEASHLKNDRWRVLSLCLTHKWDRETVPRLRKLVPDNWFAPLSALYADILDFDFAPALANARRVVIFWDAHGFQIAECVLGKIMPLVAEKDHLVIMHDLSDVRYGSEEQLQYGEHGLWKGVDAAAARMKLGVIDSAVAQSISALDFATRNHITLNSADHSLRTGLTADEQTEMRTILGELFDTQAHWFYFTLNEVRAPHKFPRYIPPRRSRFDRLSDRLRSRIRRPR